MPIYFVCQSNLLAEWLNLIADKANNIYFVCQSNLLAEWLNLIADKANNI